MPDMQSGIQAGSTHGNTTTLVSSVGYVQHSAASMQAGMPYALHACGAKDSCHKARSYVWAMISNECIPLCTALSATMHAYERLHALHNPTQGMQCMHVAIIQLM